MVVPSHDRPLRLRWLLNALEEQTLAADRFEVVVVHDSSGPATAELLAGHPLTRAGRLRYDERVPGSAMAGEKRNMGWRMARAPLIAFTDDDCRPDPRWLEELLAAAAREPGAIVQGRTRPDPFEIELLRAPHARTIDVDPPGPYAQTANILYPRDVLERADGFSELRLNSGEDTDLALRARSAGAQFAGAGDAVVFHAVEALTLRQALRVTRKWDDLAYVVKRHPQMRERLSLGIFWRPAHGKLLLAAAGLGLGAARRRPAAALLALPYLAERLPVRRGKRRLARSVVELPGRVAIDAAEIRTCARGAVRHRTPFL